MIERFGAADDHDRRLVTSASGSLAAFNRAGVLSAADVYVARRLGALSGERSEDVLLATAVATRAVRLGSVCVDLAKMADIATELPWPAYDTWLKSVAASPLVDAGVLHWEFDRLYLDRYWNQEVHVCADLQARMAQPSPEVDEALLHAGIDRVFGGPTYAEQRSAAGQAVTSWTTVLTGGPGTGKTTTVAGLLALCSEQASRSGRALRIALAAPTAKAATRLAASVVSAGLPKEDRDRMGTLPASTLHRLLGSRRENGTRFRHHRGNRLPHDVIVIDESSMVSLTMMARLLEAVRPDARLILVGDPDQLTSIEAGAVLADLVAGLAGAPHSPVIGLSQTHRFGQEIGELANAIRIGDADAVITLLRSGAAGIEFIEGQDPLSPLTVSAIKSDVLRAALAVRACAESGDAAGAIAALDTHRLLCAHRQGPYGVHHWNRQVEHWISEATGDPLYDEMYVGRPFLVTANDYGLGVYNGDSGVVVRRDDGTRRAVIGGAVGCLDLATSRMNDVETMHALTIHKSQGSQADRITVLLPPEESPLLTRELLYTAVTRAQNKVRVIGSESSVRAAVERRVQRASGLRQRLTAGRQATEGPRLPG